MKITFIVTVITTSLASATILASAASAAQPAAPVTGDMNESFTNLARLDLESSLSGAALPPASPGMLQDADEAAVGTDESTLTMADLRAPHFGQKDSWRLNFGASYAIADSGDMFGGMLSASYFFVENLSIDFVFDALWFDQSGPDTYGAGISVIFRWHFHAEPTWSLYLDAGVGFLKTSDDVPASGTNYNFTPQAGGGVSFDVGRDWRLLVGAKWHHISNANLSSKNPGRDSVQGYVMLSIPF